MLNLHKCEGYRSVNLFFVLPSSAFWLPGHTIVHTVFSKTARPHPAMAWLFGKWRAGSSMLQFSEGLRELLTQMHSCRKRKAKSKCSKMDKKCLLNKAFFAQWAFLSLFEPFWGSLGFYWLLWACQGFSGPLWASQSLGLSPASQPASQPANRPSAGQACSVHVRPLWASLGLSGYFWASLGLSEASLGRPGGLEAFSRELRPFKKTASQYVSC